MDITAVDVSLHRFLYEQLELPFDIPIYDEINLEDMSGLTQWLVIESLTNSLGPRPKQLYFLHVAVQKSDKQERLNLARLVSKVLAVVGTEPGVRFTAYDYETGEAIGELEICETRLSPIMKHVSGGSFRSITIGVVYPG